MNASSDIKLLGPKANVEKNDLAIFFVDNKLLVALEDFEFKLPFSDTAARLNLNVQESHIDCGVHVVSCVSLLKEEEILKKGYHVCHIKQALVKIEPDEHCQILKNYHWLNWNKQSKYCGACGEILQPTIGSTEKKCASCNQSFFPRFSPAIIVLIHDGDRALLARSPHFPKGNYSTIAGFIEVGETAEQAVHREVKEELGIEVTELKYFATQTWPFPDSFMIGFTARYLRGELKIDPNEIEDARWFTKEEISVFPHSASIARQLMYHFLDEKEDE